MTARVRTSTTNATGIDHQISGSWNVIATAVLKKASIVPTSMTPLDGGTLDTLSACHVPDGGPEHPNGTGRLLASNLLALGLRRGRGMMGPANRRGNS